MQDQLVAVPMLGFDPRGDLVFGEHLRCGNARHVGGRCAWGGGMIRLGWSRARTGEMHVFAK
jgi:hypothetical protein